MWAHQSPLLLQQSLRGCCLSWSNIQSPPLLNGGQKLKIGGITYAEKYQLESPFEEPYLLGANRYCYRQPDPCRLGAQWSDMTTWAALWDALCNAVSNPVIVVSVIGSVWACITDPTTKGTADSKLAMTYDVPKR